MSATAAYKQISVASDYAHYDKLVETREILKLTMSDLKWYNILKKEDPIDVNVGEIAREFVKAEFEVKNLNSLGEIGFVILHRCGSEFYFLIICSWKNNNELWESVYAKKNVDEPSFSEFTFDTSHRGTFCVWELSVIFHEQKAWRRFLMSARDDKAKNSYLDDLFIGIV